MQWASIVGASPPSVPSLALGLLSSIFAPAHALSCLCVCSSSASLQYKGLEELYKQYKDQGLVILGFPCNGFGSQVSRCSHARPCAGPLVLLLLLTSGARFCFFLSVPRVGAGHGG